MDPFVVQTLIRATAAVLVGVFIGSERARHGRAAGMRTHILVCLGACMTSLTSVFVSTQANLPGDVFRISAQVISGIGFLGAGMIILKNDNRILGLTTAAGVWTTATVGVALGYGFYWGAGIVTVLFMAATLLFARFERKRKSSEILYAELDDLCAVNAVITALKEKFPQPITARILAPKSGMAGHVGLHIVVDRHIEFDIVSLTEIEHIAFVVEE